MALILLCSAKGAPGVTTGGLAMALSWPRPVVLVEADIAGAGIFPGYLAGRVPQDVGVVRLATTVATGDLPAQFWANCLYLPTKPTGPETTTDKLLLPGLISPVEASALAGLWGPLGSWLASLDGTFDVVVDVGRLATTDARDPLVALADLVLVTTRTGLVDVATTVRLVEARVATAERTTTAWRVLTVGSDRPYSAREIARQAGLACVGTIGWDPASARVLSAGAAPPAKFTGSTLMRTAQTVAHSVVAAVAARRAQLGLGDRSLVR